MGVRGGYAPATVVGARSLDDFKAGAAAFGATEMWYGIAGVRQGNVGTIANAVNTMFVMPFLTGGGGPIDRLAFAMTIVGLAGAVARVALYNINPTTLYPTTLIVDGGSQATDAGVGTKAAVVAATLPAHTLLGFAWNSGVNFCTVRSYALADVVTPLWGTRNTPPLDNNIRGVLQVAQAYGAMPAVFPAGALPAVAVPVACWARYV